MDLVETNIRKALKSDRRQICDIYHFAASMQLLLTRNETLPLMPQKLASSIRSMINARFNHWARQPKDPMASFHVAEVVKPAEYPLGGFYFTRTPDDFDKAKADAQLEMVYVLPSLWGLGVGNRLVESAERFLKAHGARTAILRTGWDNHRAQHLYQASGWSVYAEDRDAHDDITFIKAL